MLPALAAELLEFQPLGRRLPVLRCRIIPVFAITTLQRHNLSWHFSTPALKLVILSEMLFLSQRTWAAQSARVLCERMIRAFGALPCLLHNL
jgi:hypothetical protein